MAAGTGVVTGGGSRGGRRGWGGHRRIERRESVVLWVLQALIVSFHVTPVEVVTLFLRLLLLHIKTMIGCDLLYYLS